MNYFEKEIARVKSERDLQLKPYKEGIQRIEKSNAALREKIRYNQAAIQKLTKEMEDIHRACREEIRQITEESQDHYATNGTVTGKMLHRFFVAHPEIHEIWNAEKDSLWHQVQKGGAE